MTRLSGLAGLLLWAAAAAAAQAQEVPLDQMNRDQALDFLRGSVIAQGTVTAQIDYADSRSGDHWRHTFATSYQQVGGNADRCNLHAHLVQARDGKPFVDIADWGVDFDKVRAITYGPLAGRFEQIEAQKGNVSWRLQSTPEVWHVTLFGDNGGYNEFQFYSEAMAKDFSVAASRLRAVCGATR